MGLSEHEKRMLEELERSLKAEDANLAAKLERSAAVTPKRIIVGMLLLAVGIAALIFGVTSHSVAAGAVGFLLMFGGVAFATSKSKLAPKPRKQAKSGFFQERWDRRG